MRFLSVIFVMFFLQSVSMAELVYKADDLGSRFGQIEDYQLNHYQVRHQDADFIIAQASLVFAQDKFILYKNDALIGIYTTRERYPSIMTFIQKLDCKEVQVKVEVEVLEISSNDLEELGVDWQTEGNVTNAGGDWQILGDSAVYGRMKAARQQGKARIKANPVLIVKNNSTAVIKIGDKVPIAVPGIDKETRTYEISFLDAGVKMKIKPKVISDNYIEACVEPEVSAIKGWKATSAGEYPVISTKEAQTKVVVQSGQVFVIAGLKNNNKRDYVVEVPVLSLLPIIGNLFRFNMSENEETEIIFCIKPTII